MYTVLLYQEINFCVKIVFYASIHGWDFDCEMSRVCVPRTFVEENEGVYELQMYSALETVAVLSPSAVSALIPVLSQSLRNTEQKRGIGKNASLR